MKMSIIIILIIIQEISTAHNPQLKTRAQCAHRKTQNKYLCKNKNKNRTNRVHQDYHTVDNHTIYKEKKQTNKNRAEQQPEKKVKRPRLLTGPRIHKHIIK